MSLSPKVPQWLTSPDLKTLKKLLADVRDALKKRDRFCVQIERRYGITGSIWDVDLATGAISIKGTRTPVTNNT